MHHRDSLQMLCLQRGVEHLHKLGSRTTAEALAEMADRIGGWPALLGILAEYERRLTPAMVRTAGADRFPPRPLRQVA